MNDTYFYLPEGKLPRFAATYRPDANRKIELDEAPTTNSLFFRERTYFSGTGGLVSTASDYLRFQLMLLNGGELDGVRILGPEDGGADGQQPHRQPPVASRGPGYGFGLGVSVLVDLGASGQLGSEGMFGWGGAFNTITFVDPKEDMIGIVMSQAASQRSPQHPPRLPDARVPGAGQRAAESRVVEVGGRHTTG